MTVAPLGSSGKLEERHFSRLAFFLAWMPQKRRFALMAWVFLPDHWHVIIYPPHPLSISQAVGAVKVSSMIAINHGWQEKGTVATVNSF